jgi:hypothetical protein
MSTIDDLKNNGRVPAKPGAPTLHQGFVPSLVQEELSPEEEKKLLNKAHVISMSTGNPTERTDRVKADFSKLPKEETDPKKTGVDLRKSKADDVFAPGGIFDKYVAEKTKEMKEFNAERDLEHELQVGTKGDEAETNSTGKEETEEVKPESAINEEEYEVDDEDITADTSYKSIDILNQSENEEPKMTENIDESMDSFDKELNDSEELLKDYKEQRDAEEPQKDILIDPPITKVKDYSNGPTPETEVPSVKAAASAPVEDLQIDRQYMDSAETVPDKDESDEETVEEVEDTEAAEQKRVEILKAMVTEKIKPVSKRLNISGFTVAKRGTSSNNILNMKEVPVAKWPLISTGIVVQMKEISGSNLEKIRYALSNNDARTALQILYDHIVSPKAASLEAWMKSIAFDDYDHLFMAAYIAAFADSNYIPIDCQNKDCKQKTYLTDNTAIMDMVKFKDDKAKEKFMTLYKESPVESKGLYASEIIPISEKFAIGFIEPSIYSVMIEGSYLGDEFIKKYNNTVTLLPYIDQIYLIDNTNQTLVPIEWKTFTNNLAKNIKSRVIRYDHIFDTMTADEIAVIRAYISDISTKRSDLVTYRVPETTCPVCGHVNPAVENQSASALVFLRNQLGLLVTT